MNETPTIKGVFVKSHIAAVRREKGDEGVEQLEKKYGKPLVFKNSDNVPIRDEVFLIECAVQILSKTPIPKEKVSYEAGRLHFKDFLTTPLAKILFPFFKNQFKLLMMQARSIAGHVFQGVDFSSVDLGEKAVKVVTKNNDYPVEHFQGLFQEWMEYSGLKGTVEQAIVEDSYEYTMKWE